jgi:hypothetical protein
MFSHDNKLYLVLKENISRDRNLSILKQAYLVIKKERIVPYIYTPKFYRQLFLPRIKNILYKDDNFDMDMPQAFLKEFLTVDFLYLPCYLRLCLKFRDRNHRLYNLFWRFLQIKLALEKNIFCVTENIIEQKCRENQDLFKTFGQSFWDILENKEAVLGRMKTGDLFDLDSDINEDILLFLQKR